MADRWTRGPWAAKGLFIHADVRPDPRIAYCYTAFTDCPEEEAKANALLIAAAPDLFAALAMLVECFIERPEREDFLVLTVRAASALPQARAALAKARGEAPAKSETA